MDKKIKIAVVVLITLLGISGFAVYKTISGISAPVAVVEEEEKATYQEVDKSVKVDIKYSTSKDNTIILSVSGLDGKMSSVAYELTYESSGLIKGVNSGSKPIDVSGEDGFDRDVYLGTCSKNVCKADTGVSKMSLAMEFTDIEGEKYQYTNDYDLE
ncbi:hypothetical protein ACFL1A_01050 [Patescibacteria group bacterium]